MESTKLQPPEAVIGMKEWNPELFRCTLEVPYLTVGPQYLNVIQRKLKPLFLKLSNIKPIQDHQESSKLVLLNPDTVEKFEDIPDDKKEVLKEIEVTQDDFGSKEITLDHTNFQPRVMLKKVLSQTGHDVASYSRIGHICHLNLRQELIPFKAVIGQILLLIPNVKTVVNKTNVINNTYRNFEMETLAGKDGDFLVQVKENGIKFEMDFSKVYWNPRLSTEHERLVKLLEKGDILYDVFAGIGPFAVFAAVKGKPSKKSPETIQVFANDLNPESYRWLKHNMSLNKVEETHAKCFNMDGADFIKSEVKAGLKSWCLEEGKPGRIHIAMNLPAIAVEFLEAFRGLFAEEDRSQFCKLDDSKNAPMVHVYAFNEEQDFEKDLRTRCHRYLGAEVHNAHISWVRNVSPNKDMYRVSFPLTTDVLFEDRDEESKAKRLKTDEI